MAEGCDLRKWHSRNKRSARQPGRKSPERKFYGYFINKSGLGGNDHSVPRERAGVAGFKREAGIARTSTKAPRSEATTGTPRNIFSATTRPNTSPPSDRTTTTEIDPSAASNSPALRR